MNGYHTTFTMQYDGNPHFVSSKTPLEMFFTSNFIVVFYKLDQMNNRAFDALTNNQTKKQKELVHDFSIIQGL